MIEILVVIGLASKLSAMAKAKGRSGLWGGLGPLFWFAGEFMGACCGGVGVGLTSTSVEMTGGENVMIYILALLCAGVGAGLAWAVVHFLPADENADTFVAGPMGDVNCPSCGSVQTEMMGDVIVCNACGMQSPKA